MVARIIVILFVVLLISSLTFADDPPYKHPKTGVPLTIQCLRGSPKIDGSLNDWQLSYLKPVVLDAKEQIFVGSDFWDNAKDLSGNFYVLWDDKNLYIAAVVKDDKLIMNKDTSNIWNADAIEILISTPFKAAKTGTEHYQYGFNADNKKWNWCNMDGGGNMEPNYLQIASSKTADGYICEAAIEYKNMKSLIFKAGNALGFHAVLDDTEAADREIQMTWTGLEAHDQSLGYGNIVLSSGMSVGSEGKASLTWGAIKSQ